MEKRLRCRNIISLLLSVFLSSSLFTVSSVSAVSPTGTDQYAITPSTSGFGHVTNYVEQTWNNDYPLLQSGNDYWVNVPFAAWANINLMSLRLNKPIPANSLVSLKIVWTVDSVAYNSLVKYDGLQFEHNRSYLYDSCINAYGQVQSISGKKLTLTCNYLYYNADETAIIDSIYGSHIWEVVFQSDVADVINVVISQPTSITLSNDGLSASDRAWLEEHLPAGSSTADIESAIDSAREDEKSEYEDQAQETEDAANDESSAAQGTATSLLSVVGQFIGVLTSAQPTNCNLNGNLIPHLPLGNLDLCQNSPPAAITVLGSLLLIAFVVPLAYNTVKRMLALIGSFQS